MSILLWERIRRRLRVMFRRADVESELSDEIRLHLDMESEDLMRQGKTRAEARREARLRLGGVEQTREAVRAARVLHWLESIGQDIRYGLRQFRRAPGLTLAVVASLTVGLGANVAIFSLIDAAVLRPLPVADPNRLVQLEWQSDDGTPPNGVRGMECLPQGSRDEFGRWGRVGRGHGHAHGEHPGESEQPGGAPGRRGEHARNAIAVRCGPE